MALVGYCSLRYYHCLSVLCCGNIHKYILVQMAAIAAQVLYLCNMYPIKTSIKLVKIVLQYSRSELN